MIENEYRVIGPPGTGKTTYLSKQISRALEAKRTPLVTSLTRAAAFQIGSVVEYGWNFQEDQIGTLHAHCFRALGSPPLIAKQEHLEDWNKFSATANPAWELSANVFSSNKEETSRAGMGDGLYLAYSIMRAKMISSDLWPIEIRSFAGKFSEWKERNNLFDFADLIDVCVHDVEFAPFKPDTIFVDEAQDHDRLELTLLRKWAKACDRVIIVGDPDQNLYEFRGAEPDAFYATEIPKKNTIVLADSYRVPISSHRVAMEMIGRIADRREVKYNAKPIPGEVRRLWVSLKNPHKIVEEAMTFADRGEPTMILASCEYMLAGLIKYLRESGIPFHNPYAPTRGSFNPMGDRNGVTAPQRILALLRSSPKYAGDAARLWTWGEFAAWIDPISVDGFLIRGAKKKVADQGGRNPEQIITGDDLSPLLDKETGIAELTKLEEDPLKWYQSRLNGSRAKSFEFPYSVIERNGVNALTTPPTLIIGTIHSVKGGEAKNVFVFPDLSPEGCDTLARMPASVYRMFYVALTRTYDRLFLCQNSSSMALKW